VIEMFDTTKFSSWFSASFTGSTTSCNILLFMENQMRELVRFRFWIARSGIVQQYRCESALRRAGCIVPIVRGSRRTVLRRRTSRITDCGNNARHCGSFWSRPFRWVRHAAESKIHGRLRVNTRMSGILIRPHIPAYLAARSSNNGALRPFNRW